MCHCSMPFIDIEACKPFVLENDIVEFLLSLNDRNLNNIINNYHVTGISVVDQFSEFDSNGRTIGYKRFWGPEDGTQMILKPNPIPPKNCKIEYEYFNGSRPANSFYVFSDHPQPFNLITALAVDADLLERYQVYDSNEKTIFEFPEGFPLQLNYEMLLRIYADVEKLIWADKPGYTIILHKRTPRF